MFGVEKHLVGMQGLQHATTTDSDGRLGKVFWEMADAKETWARGGQYNMVLYDTSVCRVPRPCNLTHETPLSKSPRPPHPLHPTWAAHPQPHTPWGACERSEQRGVVVEWQEQRGAVMGACEGCEQCGAVAEQ
jgi:hypothetical protein